MSIAQGKDSQYCTLTEGLISIDENMIPITLRCALNLHRSTGLAHRGSVTSQPMQKNHANAWEKYEIWLMVK